MFCYNETVNFPHAHQNCALPSYLEPHGSLLEKDCIDILMRRSVSLLLIPFGNHKPVPNPRLIFKASFQSHLPCRTHFSASEKGCFQVEKKCCLLERQGDTPEGVEFAAQGRWINCRRWDILLCSRWERSFDKRCHLGKVMVTTLKSREGSAVNPLL